jgi:hypothetical protein
VHTLVHELISNLSLSRELCLRCKASPFREPVFQAWKRRDQPFILASRARQRLALTTPYGVVVVAIGAVPLRKDGEAKEETKQLNAIHQLRADRLCLERSLVL